MWRHFFYKVTAKSSLKNRWPPTIGQQEKKMLAVCKPAIKNVNLKMSDRHRYNVRVAWQMV